VVGGDAGTNLGEIMGLAEKLDKLVPDLSATLARFPVPAALCVFVNVEGFSSNDDWQVVTGASAAFIAAGAAHLFAEGRKWPRLSNFVLAAATGGALAVVGYSTALFQASLLFLFAGLIPVLMIAAYLRPGIRQGALWLFNLRFGLAALLSSIVAVVFGVGLSSIVEALKFLFGLDLPSHLHENIWGTALSLVGPVYGLSLMPRDIEEEIDLTHQKDSLLERGVSVLVNYIAVPMVIIYALILHAYAAKIAISGGLPNGQIATMVSIFAVGGTGAWLVAWPWRETGTKLLRLFMRGWFFLTIVPAILLAIAIWRRVADYGVTPDRYGIALVAIWVAFITIYLAARRNRADMRAILGGMAVLLLAGSVGPFGANGLTIASQLQRFTDLLTANGLLKDGKAVPPSVSPASELATDGYSILYALRDAGGIERLKPMFEGNEKNPYDANTDSWSQVNGIAVWFKFSQSNMYGETWYFNANTVLDHSIAGSNRLIGPFRNLQTYNLNSPHTDMTARLDGGNVIIKAGANIWTVPGIEIVKKAKAGVALVNHPQPPILFEITPGVTIIVDSLSAKVGDEPKLESMSFWIIQRQ
jgi:Domain of unknown function (DUF4153)